jgi:hypothetical protein
MGHPKAGAKENTRMERAKVRGMCALALVVLLAGTAAAQFGRMEMPSARGVWNPVVGSGAAYTMESKREGKGEMEFAIVGTEMVAGKTGHWMEMVFKGREGVMIMKSLYTLDANSMQVKRMIMQAPGEEPMEFPMNMAMMGNRAPQSADIRNDAELVGTETITTPAGTFECQHYRAKDKSSDVWISEKVPPYGMVKMVSKDTTMTLARVITGAKSRITGTPRKFDPMEMMRRQPE